MVGDPGRRGSIGYAADPASALVSVRLPASREDRTPVNRDHVIGRAPRHELAAVAEGVRSTAQRMGLVLGIGDRAVGTVLLAAMSVIGMVAGVATRTGSVVPVLGVAAALPVVLASFRWPLIPLFAFALLTPIEEVVVIGPLGSLSRYAEILFIAAYGLPRLGRLRIRAMPAAAWGYVAWATLSLAWAVDGSATMTELPILGLLFATAVVLAALVTERPAVVRPLLWTYTMSAGVMAVVGLVAFLTSGDVTGPNDRAAALEGQNPAYYAAILLPAFVFSLHEFLSGRLVVLSASITVLAAGAIIASGTRAAWVSAVLVVFLFILPRLTPARRVATVGLTAALALGVVQVPGVMTLIVDRAALAVSTGGAGRTDIWTVGLTIYESAPLTGVGLANFPIAYTPERVRESDVGIYSVENPAYRAPHNIALGTLAELGPFGLALLAALLGPLVFRRGWGPDAAVVQAALASLVTTGLFLDILNRKQLWLLIGLACGLAYLAARERLGNEFSAPPIPASPVSPVATGVISTAGQAAAGSRHG